MSWKATEPVSVHCAEYLEKTVEKLLLNQAQLNPNAKEALLEEIEVVFTDVDYQKLLAKPTKKEVFDTISESNLHAAPGTDGLTNYFYKQCFETVGDGVWQQTQEGKVS